MSGKKSPLMILFLLGFFSFPVFAGGPLLVTGPSSIRPGRPYRWAVNPITYQTDVGGLGNQTNSQAGGLVASAFQKWQDVTTAAVNMRNVGSLKYDVTGANIEEFMNSIGNCRDSSQPVNSIVYDLDGGIITALGYDANSVLGFAGIVCANTSSGTFNRGWAVLNGRFIDGQPSSPSHQSVSLEVFKAAFIHEFGHLLGLDHSQINLNCLTNMSCSSEDLLGLPAMFPFLLDLSQADLKADDRAAISMLYPAPSLDYLDGRIQGHVFFADGQTPAQGYNVIARQVENPRTVAVSSVSGFLFTTWPGNQYALGIVDSGIQGFFGSRDAGLIGYYDIPGLPPGTYTIEVEGLNNAGGSAFVGGSSVGPVGAYLGFQFEMPGTCAPQYLHYPSSPDDSCSARSTLTVKGGSLINTNTDVILLGTQPRYDQWEDGP